MGIHYEEHPKRLVGGNSNFAKGRTNCRRNSHMALHTLGHEFHQNNVEFTRPGQGTLICQKIVNARLLVQSFVYFAGFG